MGQTQIYVMREEVELLVEPIGRLCWFTIEYFEKNNPQQRLKLGLKGETELIESYHDKIAKEKNVKFSYILDKDRENDETCQLMAIASAVRKDIALKNIFETIENSSHFCHFLFNPFGYDFEANVHIRALQKIEGKTSPHLQEVIRKLR